MNATAAVYIVDDDSELRHALTRLLEANGLIAVPCSSAREFFVQSPPPSDACLVLDLHLPDIDGLELHQLISHQHALPVVYLTGHGDVPTSVKAMKAGAVDFLEKPVSEDRLLPAVHEALRRHRETRAERDALLMLEAHYHRLTPREREVMAGVVAGKLNKQIAAELGTVEKTIKVHRARVMAKMGVQSVADLVRQAEKLALASERSPSPLRPRFHPAG